MNRIIFFIITLLITVVSPSFIYGQSKTGRDNLYIYEEDGIHSTSQCLICYFKNGKMYWENNGIETIEWGVAAIDRFISILESKGELHVYRLNSGKSTSTEVAYSGWNGARMDTFYFSKDFKHVRWDSGRKFTICVLEDNRKNNDVIYE